MLFKLGDILKVLVFQFFLLVIMFITVVVIYDLFVGFSVIYGGLTSIISSGLFAIIFFFKDTNSNSRSIVRKFYLAGMLKFFVLIFICVLIFSFVKVNSIGYFISLFFIQLMFWCGCLYIFF